MIRHLLALLFAALALPGAMAVPNEPAIAALYTRGLAGDRKSVV